jgi:hypothetical protein
MLLLLASRYDAVDRVYRLYANMTRVQMPDSTLLNSLQVASEGCAPGYSGTACRDCTKGYYRLGDACKVCPKTAYVVVLLFSLVIGT